MISRGTFVLPVHDLDMAGRDVRLEVTMPWLRGALEGCEMQPHGPGGTVVAHLSKNGTEVLVQGQVDVELTIPCARCLKPVHLRPHIELSLLLAQVAPTSGPHGGARKHARAKQGGREAAGKTNPARQDKAGGGGRERDEADDVFSAEEADLDTYEGEEVVLDRFVREAILLESPIFPLCSEACEGIRPASDTESPSSEASTDPRLLPLLALTELAKRRNTKE